MPAEEAIPAPEVGLVETAVAMAELGGAAPEVLVATVESGGAKVSVAGLGCSGVSVVGLVGTKVSFVVLVGAVAFTARAPTVGLGGAKVSFVVLVGAVAFTARAPTVGLGGAKVSFVVLVGTSSWLPIAARWSKSASDIPKWFACVSAIVVTATQRMRMVLSLFTLTFMVERQMGKVDAKEQKESKST